MKPLSDCHLYAFVDRAYLHGRDLRIVARQLCEGGVDLIQLRAKNSSADEIERMAEAILPITRQASAGLVINDHPGIAARVGAEFCHLGQEDFLAMGHKKMSDLRAATPAQDYSRMQFGFSTHAPEQAEKAIEAGADYVAVGPVYATGTKPQARPVTLDYVRWAARNIQIPWFAIGGINLDNLDEVLAAGARRICVVSAILNSDHIIRACKQFKERIARGPA